VIDWFVHLYTDPTAERLLVAFTLGAIVGAERQWQHEIGGIRVNVLVSLGAAGFVDLMLSMSPTQGMPAGVGAIVTGVGFLGAGLIMKEGFNVRGLSTAATVWCSAAMGASAGASEFTAAWLVCLFVTGANLILRPIAYAVDSRRAPPPPPDSHGEIR
jgi:putative Mg2+ transporter-C (MgtC) family protein